MILPPAVKAERLHDRFYRGYATRDLRLGAQLFDQTTFASKPSFTKASAAAERASTFAKAMEGKVGGQGQERAGFFNREISERREKRRFE